MATVKYRDQRKKAAYDFITKNREHLNHKRKEGFSIGRVCEYVVDHVCGNRSKATRSAVESYCREILEEIL